MTKDQLVQLDKLVRVQQFGETYNAQFPDASPGRQAFGAVETAIATLNREAATRVSRASEGATRKPVARAALVARLDAIARTARLIAQTTPGFDEPFKLPRPVNYGVVLSAAHAFLRDVEPLAAQFIARGLSVDFVTDLRTALGGLERAHADREAGRVARSSAQTGIRLAIKSGATAVSAIDLIVRYQFAADAEMQAAWRRARRVGGRHQAKTVANPVTSSPPAPRAEHGALDSAVDPAA